MTLRPLLAAALLAPASAAALPWDGTYLLSEEATCDGTGEGGTLRIADGVFHGLESTCRMTEPVDVLDLDATLYVMQCEGEGQEWSERAMLMTAAEGDAIFIAWRGYVFRYERCPETEEAAGDADDAGPDAETDAETDEDTGEAAPPQDAAPGEGSPDESPADGSPPDDGPAEPPGDG